MGRINQGNRHDLAVFFKAAYGSFPTTIIENREKTQTRKRAENKKKIGRDRSNSGQQRFPRKSSDFPRGRLQKGGDSPKKIRK